MQITFLKVDRISTHEATEQWIVIPCPHVRKAGIIVKYFSMKTDLVATDWTRLV
ncbi:Unknown protein sequence [Pseudomonas syringae pv. cilantro]|uniref:Uncharacterized protein n=1 Tax=Pseudomonas syringae pv. cilantro TaxID=81035 RepID=A0A0N1JMV7_PSESX|nr:Unknown protein sequence [Pseudomonas syringae pv. cilantro]